MTVINKQIFLNELSGLLTFMSEEDRLEALTLYEKMFDDASDEQALIRALRSPTMQAVIIARAYDANARKRSGAKTDEEDSPETTPDFVLAILRVCEECVPLALDEEPSPRHAQPEEPEKPVPLPGQFTLFDETPAPGSEEPSAAFPQPDASAETAIPDGGDLLALTEFEKDGTGPDIREVVVPDGPEAGPDNEPLTLDPQAAGPTEEEPEALEWVPAPELKPAPEERHAEESVERRPIVLLLILFVLAAAPLTLLGILLLLIPTLLSLLLSSASFAACGFGFMTAFTTDFAVFADVLIVFGISVILIALGILFLWLFAWFIGGAIGGLVRSVIQLGRSWCYKEVRA